MQPEQSFIIDCLNNRFEYARPEFWNTENWQTLIAEAGRHRVAPLLHQKIKKAGGRSMVPGDVVEKLKKQYLANASRNTILFHQLDIIVSNLNEKNIPVILLKGAHLAEFVYKDISLRPMSDIDILVKKEDLAKVVKIAFSEGYRFFYDEQRTNEENRRFLLL